MADQRALGAALVGAVEALPPAFRAAFLLREIHGLTYEEISDALARGPGDGAIAAGPGPGPAATDAGGGSR